MAATAEQKLDNGQGEHRSQGPGWRCLSYYGLSRARARHARPVARPSTPREAASAEVYLGLSRVYVLSRKTSRALDALERGCRVYPDHPGLARELARIERRARPPIPVLDRSHAVNRGLVRSWRFVKRWIKKDKRVHGVAGPR